MENQDIVSLKMLCYRVYATNNYFSDPKDINKIKPFEPLIINDFPAKEWKSKCYFGNVPEEIIHFNYSVHGTGLLFLEILGNTLDNTKTGQEQLEDCISKVRSTSTLFTEYRWYTTIVIEKDVDVHEYRLGDSDNGYQTQKKLNFLTKDMEKINFSEIFNKVAFCLTKEIDGDYFSKPIIENCLFVINGTDVIGRPHLSMYGNLPKIINCKSIDPTYLVSLIKRLGHHPNKRLNTIAYWRMAMLNERDKWKKYYFGFLCLENLTHTAFELLFMQNQFDLYLERSNEYDRSIITPLLDEDPEENELKLTNEFYYVVGVLNPNKYSDDVTKFKKCYDRRNKLSHGKVLKVNELPFNELNSILDFYTIEMLKFL
jgi:hypothetical protein